MTLRAVRGGLRAGAAVAGVATIVVVLLLVERLARGITAATHPQATFVLAVTLAVGVVACLVGWALSIVLVLEVTTA